MPAMNVRSIVSRRDEQPYVQIEIEAPGRVQLTPEDARAFALGVIQAAESAETDAIMLNIVKTEVGGGDEEADTLLKIMRDEREKRRYKPRTNVVAQ